MKRICKICNHTCHCVGKGYHLSSNICDICDCNRCSHSIIEEVPPKKGFFARLWQRYIDWIFDGWK